MESMFGNCWKLTSLCIGEKFTVNSTTVTEGILGGCPDITTGTLVVKGSKAPSINNSSIFEQFWNHCTLITEMTASDLGVSSNMWHGGTFTTVLDKKSVSYITEEGTSDTQANVLPISQYSTTLAEGWYYVEGNVTINSQVLLTVDVNLILCDGATLTINSPAAGFKDNDFEDISIYCQSTGSNMGKLIINATDAAINCCNVSIYGGDIQLGCTYGIKSYEEVVINGGIVTAEANDGDGIYAKWDITINGGQVTATGSAGHHGINAGDDNNTNPGGDITINGGQVTATAGGGGYGIYAENDITLGPRGRWPAWGP